MRKPPGSAQLPWHSGAQTSLLFLSTPKTLKTEAERGKGAKGRWGREDSMQLPRVPQNKAVMQNARNFLLSVFSYR